MSSQRLLTSILATAFLASSAAGFAQDDDQPLDIDFGSTRIGGEGLTETERRYNAIEDEVEELKTEDNIPPADDEKRLPHLHFLAKRYVGGKAWRDACAKYEMIIEESGAGEEGLASTPDGPKLAFKAFLFCGRQKSIAGDYDEAEKYLRKSERFGKADPRHTAIRRTMQRDKFHHKLLAGDVDAAMRIFNEYQSKQANEDERIWMGEQLTQSAWSAYRAKDKMMLERYLDYAQQVSPRNPSLRRLRDKIHTEETVLGRALLAGISLLAFVLIATRLARWRARRKVEALVEGRSGKKNKFLDDDDV